MSEALTSAAWVASVAVHGGSPETYQQNRGRKWTASTRRAFTHFGTGAVMAVAHRAAFASAILQALTTIGIAEALLDSRTEGGVLEYIASHGSRLMTRYGNVRFSRRRSRS